MPKISEVKTIAQAVENDESELKIVFYEGGGEPLRDIILPDVKSVSIYIGPEGGFAPGEVELAKEAGIRPISLGRRILRTETAGLAILSWLIYILEIQ